MPMQVIIHSKKDPSYYIEQEFYNPQEVNIGSHESNQIILEDRDQYVSKYHVSITKNAGKYYLVDRESRHGTFVHGEKVRPNIPVPIENGIKFSMGEFELALTLTGNDAPSDDENIFIKNPFDEDIHHLNAAINRLIHRYQKESEDNKKFLLIQACREILDDPSESDVLNILLRIMNENRDPDLFHSLESSDHLIEILLQSVKILLMNQRQFDEEFLGESSNIPKTKFANDSMNQLKTHLLDPNVSSTESQERLNELHRALNHVITHQNALINGYRSGVTQGSVKLVEEVCSSVVEKSVENSYLSIGFIKFPFKWIPRLFRSKLLDQVYQTTKQLQDQDEDHIEEKYFRSAFIEEYRKSYQESGISAVMQSFDEK